MQNKVGLVPKSVLLPLEDRAALVLTQHRGGPAGPGSGFWRPLPYPQGLVYPSGHLRTTGKTKVLLQNFFRKITLLYQILEGSNWKIP